MATHLNNLVSALQLADRPHLAVWLAARDLPRLAAHALAAGLHPADIEEQLTADLDAAIFEAEHDLAHGLADSETRQRLRRMQAKRDRLIAAWNAAQTAAEYRADKLAELDDTPDAAAAADAVGRWDLLNATWQTPPAAFPPADAPALPSPISTAAVHAKVLHHVNDFFARADDQETRPPRMLLNAEAGSAKTGITLAVLRIAIEARKAASLPHRGVLLIPAHRLGGEIEARARAAGINAALFKGRGDPAKPDQPCRNLEAVALARRAGAEIRTAVCGPAPGGARCAWRDGCAYFEGLDRAKAADLVIAAHNYQFDSLPKELRQDVAWVFVDEDFAALADTIFDLTLDTLAPESLARFPVLDTETQQVDLAATEELQQLHGMVMQAARACEGYLTADALRAAGFTAISDAPARMRALNWRRKMPVPMQPGMDPEAREAAARLVAVNGQIPRIAALTYALDGMLTRRETGAGLVSVRLDLRRSGSQTVLTIRGQKEPAVWLADLPVLMLNGTGHIEDVRRVYPDAELAEVPRGAAPHCRTVQITGGFGRSTLARHPTRIAELRDFITVATLDRPSSLVVTHKSTEPAFTGIPGIATAHHGDIAGSDEHAGVDAAFVIGGAFARPEDVASIAAARGGGAVTVAKPVPTPRAALLASGVAVTIDVMAYADPAMDAVHRGIYDPSIIQAAARPRGIQRTAETPVIRYLFGNVALPFPVDHLARWQDVRPDRLVRMVASGTVWTNAADMTHFRPDLFPTAKAAEHARRRFAGSVSDMREATAAIVRHDPRPWVEIAFQPPGQGQRARFVFAPAGGEAAVRAAIEDEMGAPVRWRLRHLTAGWEDTPTSGISSTYPGMGESSAPPVSGRSAADAGTGEIAATGSPDG